MNRLGITQLAAALGLLGMGTLAGLLFSIYRQRLRRLRRQQSHLHWQREEWLENRREPPQYFSGSVTDDDDDDDDDDEIKEVVNVRGVQLVSAMVASVSQTTPSVSSSRGSTLRGRRQRCLRSPAVSTTITFSDVQGALHNGSDLCEVTSVDECGRLGINALNSVIRHLEEALHRFKQFEENVGENSLSDVATDRQTAQLMHDLRCILEQAYSVKERCKQSIILEADNYVPSTDVSAYNSDEDSDSASFVSAFEILDLSNLNEQLAATSVGVGPLQNLALYRAALLELDKSGIPCRTVRTEMLGLENDTEFLGKLYCLRLAFDELMMSSTRCDWLISAAREVTSQLLRQLDVACEPFEEAFESLLEFLAQPHIQPQMMEELQPRGVKSANVFDVCLDYIFLDAFEQLAAPPASLVSVIQNRWLSAGFKRNALVSVVWTLVLAKKKMLRYPEGFLAHYYDVCAIISPALAWGFLGPDEKCRQICEQFKSALLKFVCDMFDFRHVRYTNVEELAADLFLLTQRRIGVLMSSLGGNVDARSSIFNMSAHSESSSLNGTLLLSDTAAISAAAAGEQIRCDDA